MGYRNSQLARRRTCGFAYQQTYVLGDPGQPNPHLHRGREVHRAILEAAKEVLSGALTLNIHEIAYRTISGGDVEYAEALDVLTTFQEGLGEDYVIDRKRTLFLEEKLETQLALADGTIVTFEGTPDIVSRVNSDTLRIEDWKTAFRPDTEEQFKADPQLKRYALLLADHFPHHTQFELVKHFVRYRGNNRRMVITRAELQQVRIDLVAEIEIERERAAAGDFEAQGGAWCSLCEHTHTCPIIRAYRDHGADDISIDTPDDARRLASDVIALDAWAGATKERLKQYLSNHPTGRVPVAGGEYGFGTTAERIVPPDELMAVLRDHSLEPPAWIFNTDLKALDRYMKRLPESTVAAIRAITRKRETSRCQFRRTGDEPAAAPELTVVNGGLF